jgi:hypothetical protein
MWPVFGMVPLLCVLARGAKALSYGRVLSEATDCPAAFFIGVMMVPLMLQSRR